MVEKESKKIVSEKGEKKYKPDINKDNLFRLPWSKNDHGNGWLEITTFCNMACPGCYKGCHIEGRPRSHFPLKEVKEDILHLKKVKNCQTVTISGGEPLMHPDIVEIVKFIKDNGMEPFILTNGVLAKKPLLQKLKDNGLVGLEIRVDSLRINRKQTEEQLNELRKKHADTVNEVGGLFLGLTAVVGKQNLEEVGHIFEFGRKNPDKVNLITLILMRQFFFSEKEKLDTSDWIDTEDLCKERVRFDEKTHFSAFLGSHHEDYRLRWLYAFWLNLDGETLGYLDGEAVRLAQFMNHFKEGRYFYIRPKEKYYLSILSVFGIAIFNKSFRKMLGRFFLKCLKNPKYFFKKASLQQFFILRPPGFVDGKRDVCDDCPCMTKGNDGRLTPSCILDECNFLGGNYRELNDKELKEYKKKWGV